MKCQHRASSRAGCSDTVEYQKVKSSSPHQTCRSLSEDPYGAAARIITLEVLEEGDLALI